MNDRVRLVASEFESVRDAAAATKKKLAFFNEMNERADDMNDRAKLAAKRLAGFFGGGPKQDWPEVQEAIRKLEQLADGVGGTPPGCEPDKTRCVTRCVVAVPEMERLLQVDARYEYLSKLTPREFSDLYVESLRSGVTFDGLVDEAIRKQGEGE